LEALVRPGRKMAVGERVLFGGGELEAEILARGELGLRTICFRSHNDQSVEGNIERFGHVPLPPYIDRPDESLPIASAIRQFMRKKPGAVAAPTAGLHFTSEDTPTNTKPRV